MARLQGFSALRPLWQGALSFGESERAMSDAPAICKIVRPTLHHFGLTTANLEAMLDWYCKVPGMTPNHQTSKPLGTRGPSGVRVVSRTAGSCWRVPVGVGRQESRGDRSPSEGHARAQEALYEFEFANRIRPYLESGVRDLESRIPFGCSGVASDCRRPRLCVSSDPRPRSWHSSRRHRPGPRLRRGSNHRRRPAARRRGRIWTS